MKDIHAEIHGTFTKISSLGDVVKSGEKIGEIYSLGQQCDVRSTVHGTVQWVRSNGKVSAGDKVYTIG